MKSLGLAINGCEACVASSARRLDNSPSGYSH